MTRHVDPGSLASEEAEDVIEALAGEARVAARESDESPGVRFERLPAELYLAFRTFGVAGRDDRRAEKARATSGSYVHRRMPVPHTHPTPLLMQQGVSLYSGYEQPL